MASSSLSLLEEFLAPPPSTLTLRMQARSCMSHHMVQSAYFITPFWIDNYFTYEEGAVYLWSPAYRDDRERACDNRYMDIPSRGERA